MTTLPLPAQEGNPSEKVCKSCGNSFPATPEFFYRNKGCKDGLLPVCKLCRSARDKVYYDEHLEEIRVSSRRYYSEHREERQAYNRSYSENHREELRQYASEYFRAHHEAQCEQLKQYYKQHHEEIRLYRARRYQLHGEMIRERGRLYYQTERGRTVSRINSHNRRARKRNAPGTLTPEQIQRKLKAQHYRCYYCLKRFEIVKGKYLFHLEHTIPLSRTEHSPRHDENFVVLACPLCNLKKRNKLPHEFGEGGRLL